MKKELIDFIEKEKVLEANPKLEMVPANLLTQKIKELFVFEKTAQEDFREWFLENDDAIVNAIQEELDAWKHRHNIPKIALPHNLARIDDVDVDELNYGITNSIKAGVLNVLDTRTI